LQFTTTNLGCQAFFRKGPDFFLKGRPRGSERFLRKREDFADVPGKFLIKYKIDPQILANSEGLYYTDVYYLTEEAGKAPR
jgi:Holliday junction resolvasome RuvABC ATP-dependent DNA helicase subunit